MGGAVLSAQLWCSTEQEQHLLFVFVHHCYTDDKFMVRVSVLQQNDKITTKNRVKYFFVLKYLLHLQSYNIRLV